MNLKLETVENLDLAKTWTSGKCFQVLKHLQTGIMKAADLLRAQQVLKNERRIDLQSRRRQMESYFKAVVAATQKASESFDGCPSPVNIDWDSAAAIPNIRKSMPSNAVLRSGTIDYSLSDSLDAAKDLEIHANFLLDEALTNCNTGAHNVPLPPPHTSLDQYNSFPSVSSNPMPVVREKSAGKSVRISSDDDDGPSRKVQRKDSRDGKEQQSFFSAKSVFEDEVKGFVSCSTRSISSKYL